MIRRRLTFALLPFALSAQLGTAHAQPARPATSQPVPAAPAPALVLPDNPDGAPCYPGAGSCGGRAGGARAGAA